MYQLSNVKIRRTVSHREAISAGEPGSLSRTTLRPFDATAAPNGTATVSAMSPPWLSILVPVYAVAPYLDACIASILDQEVEGVEVIFVDDASPDGEGAMLRAWQARHPGRVRVITHPTNRGIAATRNTLLAHAHGEYLWFVDSDDLMAAGSIAALRQLLSTQRPDMVLCDFRVLRDDPAGQAQPGAARSRKHQRSCARDAHVTTFDGPAHVLSRSRDRLVRGLFNRGHMHLWSKIIRRKAWPSTLRFSENRNFEDLELSPRLALSMNSYIHMPHPWIVYRQRQGSILSTPSTAKLCEWMGAAAGYGSQLRTADAAIRPATLFVVAHFLTREWRNCVRAFDQMPCCPEARQTRERFRDAWRRASPLSTRELTLAYLKRGQFRRCLQMHALLVGSHR